MFFCVVLVGDCVSVLRFLGWFGFCFLCFSGYRESGLFDAYLFWLLAL